MKNDIGQWVNKHSKHINEGYPLVTLLVCLVEDAQYGKQMEVMSEFLVKQMKVKEYRWGGDSGTDSAELLQLGSLQLNLLRTEDG